MRSYHIAIFKDLTHSLQDRTLEATVDSKAKPNQTPYPALSVIPIPLSTQVFPSFNSYYFIVTPSISLPPAITNPPQTLVSQYITNSQNQAKLSKSSTLNQKERHLHEKKKAKERHSTK